MEKKLEPTGKEETKSMSPEETEQLMKEFKESRGWKLIQDWLKPLIDSAEMRLLSDEDLNTDSQKDLKKSWKLHKKFYNMPDFIVAKSKAGIPSESPSLDPYE